MFLKPIKNRIVPDPAHGDLLPPDGRDCPETQYWLKRLADGDVIKFDPKPTKSTKSNKSTGAK